MTETIQTFTVADPKEFDGDPFEVAERACAQAAAIAKILEASVKAAESMALNAQMTRNLQETPANARAEEWPESVYAKRLQEALKAAAGIEKVMTQVGRAAGFNPKAPLPKDA